jgi:hypothetical protein
MRLLVGLGLAVCCGGALGGCSVGPVTLKLAYQASSDRSGTGSPRAVPCRIGIATVTDGRPDISRNSLGDRGSGPVAAEHVPEWVGEGLNTLVEQRLATWARSSASPASAGAAAEPGVIAAVSIRRLYTRAVATDLEAVIVLEVRYTPLDGPALQRDYRASAQKLNWFAAEGEVQDVLNRALEDVVQQIAGDLAAVCTATPRTRFAR